VDPNHLRVSLVAIATLAGVVALAGVLGAVFVPEQRAVLLWVMAALLLMAAITAVLRIIEIRNVAYLVRAHDLSYRRGVLVKRVSTVPFVRVQHARLRQGPVERRFGLATLEVNSAGPDLQIRGLASETAERLKVLVVERAGDLVEE